MDNEYRREALHRMLDAALDAQERNPGTVAFFRYAGHVNAGAARIETPGRDDLSYRGHVEMDTGSLYFDGQLTEKAEIESAITRLKNFGEEK